MRISDWSSDVCSSDLLLPEMLQQDLTGQIAALQPFHDDFVAAYAEFARRHGVHIIAPSLPVQHGNVFVNRSYLLAPNGAIAWQDKRQMTRFEREAWIITGGAALKVFDLDLGGPVPLRAGITICRSEEHTSELQSLMRISYAVFCLNN